MAIEQARVGEVAAQMMDALEQQQYGEDAEITDVMLIAAVDYDNGATTTVHYSSSAGMPTHVALGLLTHVQVHISRQS
jgi:pyruvate kinase